jgi:hypothetical protein
MATAKVDSRRRRLTLGVGLMALAAVLVVPPVSAAAAKTKLVSKGPASVQGNTDSGEPEVSANGRFVVYESEAENLVSNDDNGDMDIFLYDRKKNKTKRVSVNSSGLQAHGKSYDSSISANGRYILFTSEADDLVPGDGNNSSDVFVYDKKKKTTKRVSVRGAGIEGDSNSWNASISADGRFVAFGSEARNLVASDSNNEADVFVRDLKKKKTKLVSIKSNGVQGDDESGDSHISANGRFIGFSSDASNLVSKDNNGETDVFVHDRKKKKTKRVSVKSNGKQANGDSVDPVMSANGRFVGFASDASSLRKGSSTRLAVFVHDRASKKTKMVSVRSNGKQGNDNSDNPSISANGRWISFQSDASNLGKKDTNNVEDVFVHDRQTKKTRRVSLRSNGGQGNGNSDDAWISGDGRWIVFESDADNLIGSDNNNLEDVFVRGRIN